MENKLITKEELKSFDENQLINYIENLRLSFSDWRKKEFLELLKMSKEDLNQLNTDNSDTTIINCKNALIEVVERDLKYEPMEWKEIVQKGLDNIDQLKSFKYKYWALGGDTRAIFQVNLIDNEKVDVIGKRQNMFFDEIIYEKTKTESISLEEFKEFLKDIDFLNFDKEFIEPDIKDGDYWNIDVIFNDNQAVDLHIVGSNKYPEKFSDLNKFFWKFYPNEYNGRKIF